MLSRRKFLGCAALAAGVGPSILRPSQGGSAIDRIKDPDIQKALKSAIDKNLVPAAVEEGYPGQFNITADGSGYGGWATWPGLDSWQMAGAYLLIGKDRLVKDYFDFVCASQRKDGNIPFAIFTGDTRPDETYLSGLKLDDIFTYGPPKREGLPASSQESRKWIGLFTHWQAKAECLSTLGPVCHILSAAEIFDYTQDTDWLTKHLPSAERAAEYLRSRISPNGLVAHSGFYVELPPRYGWDGVAQCYVIHAFRELARLSKAAQDNGSAIRWNASADRLAMALRREFWRGDHFGEYVHETKGLVDSHGLSDTNWAAVAFGVARDEELKKLWPLLLGAKDFWWGGMPTLTVTKPFSYETWEYNEKVPMEVPPLNDVAAMGRVWYLEAMACVRMKEWGRLRESTRKVAKMASSEGYWRERYQPKPDHTAEPSRTEKYCEYPAVFARVVLGNSAVFT